MSTYAPAATLDPDVLREMFEVNAIAPLVLFQVTHALLQKSAKPIFIGMTSAAAMIGGMEYVPTMFAGYGASKAALNSIVRRLHFDHPELISFVIHPGLVC
jgi:norsolorinic acid ketoreductase